MTNHLDAMMRDGSVDGALDFCPLMSNYGPPPAMFIRGEGTELWDAGGKRYLDFLTGLAVVSLGHSHPVVSKAIADQAAKLSHTSNLYATEHQAPVALEIDRLIGGSPGQVLFQNSGAEANEAAIKLARKFQGRGRHKALSAFRSFHGRTLATLAAGATETIQIAGLIGSDPHTDLTNDATVTAVDVEADNGIIHVIDTVLLPPA